MLQANRRRPAPRTRYVFSLIDIPFSEVDLVLCVSDVRYFTAGSQQSAHSMRGYSGRTTHVLRAP